MTATKTQSKPAAKSSKKPTVKKDAAVKTPLAYAAMLADALEGKYGLFLKRYYGSAVEYHQKAKTAFPRSRLASTPLLKPEDAAEFLKKHEKTSLPPGSYTGQRLFDEMVLQASQK